MSTEKKSEEREGEEAPRKERVPARPQAYK